MNLLLWLLLMAPHPVGLQRVEFDPRMCKHTSEVETHCKWARVEFQGVALKDDATVLGTGDTSRTLQMPHPAAKLYEYHYEAAKCKPIPNSRWWVCKDFWWRELDGTPRPEGSK